MNDILIRDSGGRVIQIQKTYGTRTTAYTPGGKPLGYYDSKWDKTYTQGGVVLTSGNTLAALTGRM